jgi:hypothetical protein
MVGCGNGWGSCETICASSHSCGRLAPPPIVSACDDGIVRLWQCLVDRNNSSASEGVNVW